MPVGVFRRVFLIGRFAVKVPRFRHLAGGMCSNRWEREMWTVWRPFFGWKTLCAVHFGDPAGFVLVMARTKQPVTQTEIQALPKPYPGITAETKPEDYGHFGGRLVAVDYGIWDYEEVRTQRAYYQSFVNSDRPHYSDEEQDA